MAENSGATKSAERYRPDDSSPANPYRSLGRIGQGGFLAGSWREAVVRILWPVQLSFAILLVPLATLITGCATVVDGGVSHTEILLQSQVEQRVVPAAKMTVTFAVDRAADHLVVTPTVWDSCEKRTVRLVRPVVVHKRTVENGLAGWLVAGGFAAGAAGAFAGAQYVSDEPDIDPDTGDETVSPRFWVYLLGAVAATTAVAVSGFTIAQYVKARDERNESPPISKAADWVGVSCRNRRATKGTSVRLTYGSESDASAAMTALTGPDGSAQFDIAPVLKAWAPHTGLQDEPALTVSIGDGAGTKPSVVSGRLPPDAVKHYRRRLPALRLDLARAALSRAIKARRRGSVSKVTAAVEETKKLMVLVLVDGSKGWASIKEKLPPLEIWLARQAKLKERREQREKEARQRRQERAQAAEERRNKAKLIAALRKAERRWPSVYRAAFNACTGFVRWRYHWKERIKRRLLQGYKLDPGKLEREANATMNKLGVVPKMRKAVKVTRELFSFRNNEYGVKLRIDMAAVVKGMNFLNTCTKLPRWPLR